jgi:hypothetical protein
MPDYLPRGDIPLRNWARNFSALITASPGAYGLMASDAATIAAAVGLYAAALVAAIEPSTRTAPAVAGKNAKRAAMKITLRRYAQWIKLNLGVSHQQKIGLGLRLDNRRNTPLPAPTTAPICVAAHGAPFRHTLRITDSATPRRRSKPRNALFAAVDCTLSAVPAASPSSHSPAAASPSMPASRAAGPGSERTLGTYLFSRSIVSIDLPHDAFGQLATYRVRWSGGNGRNGPWSAAVSLIVS